VSTSKTGARAIGTRTGHDHDRGRKRTPAQWYCLLAGLALLLAGIFGFIADASFDTGATPDTDPGGNANGALQGDSFLGFEVNGWHNIVHLVSGLVLLAAAAKAKSAKTVALTFGLVYGLVTIIGLIDGRDVIGLLPVNGPDNILHLALSALGIIAGLVSKARRTNRGGVHNPTRSDELGDGRFERDTTTGNVHDPASGSTRAEH